MYVTDPSLVLCSHIYGSVQSINFKLKNAKNGTVTVMLTEPKKIHNKNTEWRINDVKTHLFKWIISNID